MQTSPPSLSPQDEKLDPQQIVELRPARPGVMRLNRRVVAILLMTLALVVGFAFMIGFDGGRRPRAADKSNENLVRPGGAAQNALDGLPKDYSFLGEPTYEQKTPATQPIKREPTPDELALLELQRKQLEALRKELEKSLDSPLQFSSVKPAREVNETKTSAVDRGTTLEPDRSESTRRIEIVTNTNGTVPADAQQKLQSEKEKFLGESGAVEPYLKKPLLHPLSAYEVKAGTVIPGALVTGINTDLPGEVIAQVTENVYDSVTGHYLLIPQGARLLGKYQSLVSNGQNRALIVWRRLVLPNGNSIVLDAMPGTDQQGYAGLKDRVDYHLDKLGTAVALTTGIAYAGNLARSPNGGNGQDARDVVGDTVAQEGAKIGQRIVDRQLDVQPTITIRPGWPLRVLVNKDMLLAPYTP
jgi:type IV secretion system protein VirB10